MASRRKPGLWFSAMKVEIEDVKKAHRKVCIGCGTLPQTRRLKVVRGSGRNQTTEVRCIPCGGVWLTAMERGARRARKYLWSGKGEIRK